MLIQSEAQLLVNSQLLPSKMSTTGSTERNREKEQEEEEESLTQLLVERKYREL